MRGDTGAAAAPFTPVSAAGPGASPSGLRRYSRPLESGMVEIHEADLPLRVSLAYAGRDNFVGRRVYAEARCALHADAAACLAKAAWAARRTGHTLQVLDAYRPPAAQAVFWAFCPDPAYVSDAGRGSHHSRGVAVDVTLLDAAGTPLDMGSAFDTMTDISHHDRDGLPPHVQRNRYLLLGIMLQAGFRSNATEWWHYELPQAERYPFLDDPVVTVVSQG